jgi:two-component system sensor histidine kinase DesK
VRKSFPGRYIWLWAAIWLIYLIEPVQVAWHHHELWRRVTGIGVATTFSALYLVGFVRVRAAIRRTGDRSLGTAATSVLLGGMAVLTVALALIIGQSAVGSVVYVGVMAMFLLPTRGAWTVVAVLAAATIAVPRVAPGWKPTDDPVFSLVAASLAMWGIMRLLERNAQLAAAREEIARLAVANERNRFARDLHDLLGHSLTVVSVKAELAGRLVPLAPQRAQDEIADIRRLAREALADVRTAVGGYRDVSLGAELARARGALEAADIEPDLPSYVDEVPEERQELFGWVVREGVTNVVRHSGAKRCRVRLTADAVEIEDDGRGPGTVGADGTAGAAGGSGASGGVGSGLTGLRERAAAVGGSVAVRAGAGGGFVLRVAVP